MLEKSVKVGLVVRIVAFHENARKIIIKFPINISVFGQQSKLYVATRNCELLKY